LKAIFRAAEVAPIKREVAGFVNAHMARPVKFSRVQGAEKPKCRDGFPHGYHHQYEIARGAPFAFSVTQATGKKSGHARSPA
jgi:hypothetical protein